MKKAIAAIVLCVALTLCMSLSAFAADDSEFYDLSAGLTLTDADIYGTNSADGTKKWYNVTDISYGYIAGDYAPTFGKFFYNARFGINLDAKPFEGFRLNYNAKPDHDAIKIDSGYYFVIKIMGYDTTTLGSWIGSNELYFNACVIDNYGNSKWARTVPVLRLDTDYWEASLMLHFGDGDPFSISRFIIESNMPSTLYGSMYYDVAISLAATKEPTEAQRLHNETIGAIGDAADEVSDAVTDAGNQITGAVNDAADDITAHDDVNTDKIITNDDDNTDKIIANDDANTDKITDSVGDAADDITANQDANTDKIIENENKNHEDLKNGWDQPGEDPANDVDNMTEDMGDAENAALGGKTDEEIQAEISGVLGSNNLPGVTSSGMISSLFDKMLLAFGNEYQALLILSLVLGLAAFLVGKQYRARGD